MTAREEILGRVREAVRGAPQPPDVDRGYRSAAGVADPVGLFAERVAEYRAEVARVAEADLSQALAGVLRDRSVIVPADLPFDVSGAVADAGQSAAELDRIDAVVTTCALAVAITGTIVLDHGPGQGRRALTLVPDVFVCVVRADQVVADVPDAVALLDPRRPQTWISGPSATSDIELRRVEGVHGPRTLHVLIVE